MKLNRQEIAGLETAFRKVLPEGTVVKDAYDEVIKRISRGNQTPH
jgi:hypothetical protein